ncbi:MAG: hypothetical protein RBS73_17170 [Prolixibacteraceae bacterium]|jgi:hypothetical protein|nr:hypothetical protein [Prolixibacteraceae bacterium]
MTALLINGYVVNLPLLPVGTLEADLDTFFRFKVNSFTGPDNMTSFEAFVWENTCGTLTRKIRMSSIRFILVSRFTFNLLVIFLNLDFCHSLVNCHKPFISSNVKNIIPFFTFDYLKDPSFQFITSLSDIDRLLISLGNLDLLLLKQNRGRFFHIK